MCGTFVARRLPPWFENTGKREVKEFLIKCLSKTYKYQAGRMVGAAVLAAAKADPRFTADFAAAKAELRAALGM